MRTLPVGPEALLVEVASGEEAQALHADLLRRRAEGSRRPVRSSRPRARCCSTACPTPPAWPPN